MAATTSNELLQPIAINASAQIPLKLDSTNYLAWKFQFRTLLTGYDLLGFLDGSKPCSPATIIDKEVTSPNPAYPYWIRQDNLILSTIISSITPTIISFIAAAETSKEAWDILARTYGTASRGRIMALKQQLHNPVKGKFGAILASIPLPIIGALYCVLFALMSAAGFDLLHFCNLNSYRTKFILGFSIYMGLSVPQYFNGYVIATGRGPVQSGSASFDQIMQVIFTSPTAVAGIIAYFLDITLARRHPLTRKDSGRHWWAKFKYYGRDPRSEEFYSLPYGLSKYFPSV